MNISQLGIASTAAVTTLLQARGSETDRVQQETAIRERAVDSTSEAEAAEGIGTTNEEQAASDRDADGRRPWEMTPTDPGGADPSDENGSSQRAKDPTGQAGSKLDLSG